MDDGPQAHKDEPVSDEKEDASSRLTWLVIDWAIRASVPVIAAGLLATANILWELNDRVSRIEETRFTSTDGERLKDEIMRSQPPEWVKDMLVEIKADQKELKAEMADLRRELIKRMP